MLGAIPDQYHLFVGIGGLVFLLLIITGFAQRYQAYQLEKQAALRRILRGVQQIEYLLSMTEGCAVPKKLIVLLRKEVLARYMAIHQIYKRFENLNSLISQAQKHLASSESKAEIALTKPTNRETLNQYVKGLTELINFLFTKGHIAGMNGADRQQYQQDLISMRADYISLFHTGEATLYVEKQQWHEAGRHMKEALQYFRQQGTSNQHLKELYDNANRFYKEILEKQFSQAVAPGESEGGQSDSENAGVTH